MKRMCLTILTLVLVFATLAVARAEPANEVMPALSVGESKAPSEAPIEVVQPNEYFYVLDDADVLSDETQAHIVRTNDALHKAYGAQIVFVTLETTGSVPISDYALHLANSWGVGDREKHNGIVVLLAIEDDDYYYTHGDGLVQTLPIATMSELANDCLEPSFAAKDYDTGVRRFFDALAQAVTAIYAAEAEPTPQPSPDTFFKRLEDAIAAGVERGIRNAAKPAP